MSQRTPRAKPDLRRVQAGRLHHKGESSLIRFVGQPSRLPVRGTDSASAASAGYGHSQLRGGAPQSGQGCQKCRR